MHTFHPITLSLGLSLFAMAGSAYATPNLAFNYNTIQLQASSPSANTGVVTVPMTNNTGYTEQAPFQIPCDVTEFSGGASYSYVNNDVAVYPELTVYFYLNGDEDDPIASHGYNNVIPAGFDSRSAPDDDILMTQGQTLSEGIIAITQSVPFWQYGFQGSDLPANAPVKMHIALEAFSCDTYDVTANGYAPACLLPDAVPWNNAINIWVQRTCP